jgi:prepilin-type processing-associated H-X9-DG protein
MACHEFLATYDVFPPGHLAEPGRPDQSDAELQSNRLRNSWTGHLGFLFPYIEQTALYESLDHDLWKRDVPSGPAWFNRPGVWRLLTIHRIPIFHCPSDPDVPEAKSIAAVDFPFESAVVLSDPIGNAGTNYLGCAGTTIDGQNGDPPPSGIFFGMSAVRPGDVRDGLASTLLLGEVLGDSPEDRPWTVESRHAVLCGAVPVMEFWQADRSFDAGPTYASIFRSRHRGWVNMGFADGSVHRISSNIDRSVLHALGSIAGGETVASSF